MEIDSGSNPTIRYCRIYDGKGLGFRIKQTAQATIEDCKLEGIPSPGIKIDSKIQPTIRRTSLNTKKPYYLRLAAILILPVAVVKGLLISAITFFAVALTLFLPVFYVFQKRGFSNISNVYTQVCLISYIVIMLAKIGATAAVPELAVFLLIYSIITFSSFKLSFQEYRLKKQYRLTKNLK